jgi:Tfp pilus assembly protein PilV
MTPKQTAQFTMVATVAATVISLAAFALSLYTYHQTSSTQNQVTASTLWQSYHASAMANPTYAEGKYDATSPSDRHQYELFASNAMLTAEAVFLLQRDDEQWRNTLVSLVLTHKNFVRSSEFRRAHFHPSFVELVDASLGSYET